MPVKHENQKIRQSLTALAKSENHFLELRDALGIGPAINFENGSLEGADV